MATHLCKYCGIRKTLDTDNFAGRCIRRVRAGIFHRVWCLLCEQYWKDDRVKSRGEQRTSDRDIVGGRSRAGTRPSAEPQPRSV